MKKQENGKWRIRELKENKKVAEFLERIGKKSGLTERVYGTNLGYCLNSLSLTPDEVLKIAGERPQELVSAINAQITMWEKEGIKEGTIWSYLTPLLSFLKYYDVAVNRRKFATTPEEDEDGEIVPEKLELQRLLRVATPRAKAIISLLAFSGLRPESIGKFNGTDGLRLSDLPDLKIKDGIEFMKKPAQILVRKGLSKNKKHYFTFLTAEGCVNVIDYLNYRISTGEVLTQDSPLILSNINKSRSHQKTIFLRTVQASADVSGAMMKCGLKMRPYVLRAYFATGLDLAENKGVMGHSWRQFFMGHAGDIERRYSTGKKLGTEMIEEMRTSFSKCERFLQTQEMEVSVEVIDSIVDEQTKKRILSVFGYTPEEFDNIDFKNLSDEDWQKMLTPRLDEVYRKIFFSRYTSEEILKQAEESKEEIEEDPKSNREVIIPEEFYEAYIMAGFRMNKVASEFLRKQKKVSMELP